LINDAFKNMYEDMPMSDNTDPPNQPGPNLEAGEFYRLIKDSEKPLWTGCELSQLSLLVILFNIKSMKKAGPKPSGPGLELSFIKKTAARSSSMEKGLVRIAT
jgi:hypothetical protein